NKKLDSQTQIPTQKTGGRRLRSRDVLLPEGPASRSLRLLPLVALGVDVLAILGSEVLAAVGRGVLPSLDPSTADYVPRVLVAAHLVDQGWIAMIAAMGGYTKSVFGHGLEEFKRVVNASLVAAALVVVGCYLLRFDLSRGFVHLTFL
ncbi:MAG: hypothetical protein JWR20_519, partial [Marmoricola sp.]|nr:hypothetical protein [Marmoricola sp.]